MYRSCEYAGVLNMLLVLNMSGSGSDSCQTSGIILCDVLVDMILVTSNCTAEKAGINFEIATEKIGLFLSMLLLNGYHKLPDHKMFWKAALDTFV